METSREHFIENYMVLFQKDLLEKLPEKACVTKMLLDTGRIVNSQCAHIIAGIHKGMKDVS